MRLLVLLTMNGRSIIFCVGGGRGRSDNNVFLGGSSNEKTLFRKVLLCVCAPQSLSPLSCLEPIVCPRLLAFISRVGIVARIFDTGRCCRCAPHTLVASHGLAEPNLYASGGPCQFLGHLKRLFIFRCIASCYSFHGRSSCCCCFYESDVGGIPSKFFLSKSFFHVETYQ